jgi:hypothetical protein
MIPKIYFSKTIDSRVVAAKGTKVQVWLKSGINRSDYNIYRLVSELPITKISNNLYELETTARGMFTVYFEVGQLFWDTTKSNQLIINVI